jgi:DNA repair protein RecO
LQLEGILIHKAIHKERDLIATLLLRDGSLASIYFYGGRGGGKSQKGSILEIGFMLKVKMAARQKKNSDILSAKEWELVWHSDLIRANHQAFYLSTFFFEFIKKIAIPYDGEFEIDENKGLFKVLSNALFFMDKSIQADEFHLETHFLIFMSKVIYELGISPDIDHCLYCEVELKENSFVFEANNGGFACSGCSSQSHSEEIKSSNKVRNILKYAKVTTYKEIKPQKYLEKSQLVSLLNYICYHYGWNKSQFISLNLVL